MRLSGTQLIFAALGIFLSWPMLAVSAGAATKNVHIGVLAHRADSLKMWSPTADYLTRKIPGYRFDVVLLDNDTIGPAIERREMDFVLTNPGSYIGLEAKHGVTRILTLRNLRQGKPYTAFGVVIFTRADRNDIRTLTDLKGKSFMAVDKEGFGGFLIGWRELKDAGIDPFRDFSEIKFVGLPLDKIVYGVIKGEADAGIVRTDTLERMAEAGKIDIATLRVINRKNVPDFPFALSSRLYPEWPLAKLKHASDELAQKVASALLVMPPDSTAATASLSVGWTVPLDYTPVHELYKELRVGPYKDFGKVTFGDVFRLYKHWILIAAFAMVLLSVTTVYILKLNRGMKRSQSELLVITQQLEKLSVLDGLTGIANHRCFQEHLDREWKRARRNQTTLSLLMIDIDDFKNLNDTHGHLAGDVCLKQVAQTLAKTVKRPGDLVARYGGEEFVVVLPETDERGALLLAERMRRDLAALEISFPEGRNYLRVTSSFGLATMIPGQDSSPQMLVSAADKALYRAKAAGRNCVTVFKAA